MPEGQPAGKNVQRGRRRLLPAPWLSRRRRGEHGQTPDRRRRPAAVAELHASTPGRPEGAPNIRIWTARAVTGIKPMTMSDRRVGARLSRAQDVDGYVAVPGLQVEQAVGRALFL